MSKKDGTWQAVRIVVRGWAANVCGRIKPYLFNKDASPRRNRKGLANQQKVIKKKEPLLHLIRKTAIRRKFCNWKQKAPNTRSSDERCRQGCLKGQKPPLARSGRSGHELTKED